MAHLHRLPPILLAIALLAAAALPMAAPADPSPVPSSTAGFAEAAAEDEGELEEECVVVEEEFVDGELLEFCEEEEESEAASSTEKCFLRSAHAHAAKRGDKLKLTIGYTTYEPVSARIEIRRGAARIGTFKRHLGKSGVLRFTSKQPGQRSNGVSVRIRPAQGAADCPARRLVLRAG